MITVRGQKDIALAVLKKINQNLDGEAGIFGGAPRNWEDGKLARDIDIYIRESSLQFQQRPKLLDLNLLKEVLGDEFDVKEVVAKTCGEYSFGLPLNTINTTSINGVEFQFIVVKSKRDFHKELLDSFSVGISKIGITSSGEIKSPDYLKDRNDETITYYYSHLSDEQSVYCLNHYLRKIINYYPDHRLVLEPYKEVSYDPIPF